ncbi:DUF2637 domain-containing protein [Rhodococcus sp. IEGM 1351]|uniref:DUF2637 domain-containing protein n=1 Tax=Rhodococcus sp. IEGM 1351 TaxID=3047089 RepID=UPI0024B830E1|nr:DUF2637 domain-containing protein [Rhodococcus sp. IEGM 1351]MDI9938807.1 DUF2637 domain-containing protein [Rhodococcus sp. IEGM 1351]
MTDLNLRAARIQLRGLIVALLLAITFAVGITVGAFVLSFAVLRDLAQQAGIPYSLAWIFPLIVDGAILGATIAVVALSKISGNAAGKKFFMALAVVVVLISVLGNAYHADQWATRSAQKVAAGVDLGYAPLSPTGAALIAIIAPLLVLAFTHGVGVLIKAIGNAHADSNAFIQESRDQEQQANELESERHNDPIRQAPSYYERNRADVASMPVADVSGVAPNDVANDVAATTRASVAKAATRATSVVDDAGLVESQADIAAAVEPAVAAGSAPIVADADSVAEVDQGEWGVVRNAPDEDSQEIYVLPDEEQTIENLLDFIDNCDDFEPVVKETARLRITQNLSYAEIATTTRAKAASTAMRRFVKVEQRAVEAGFRTPPLPEVDDATDGRIAATPDQQYALVGAR